MHKSKITNAEMCIMRVLWDSPEKLTSNEILARLPEKGWKITTLITLAGKLIDKGIIHSEKIGRAHAHHYSPLISEEEYKRGQTHSFLASIHNGSIKSLMNAICDNEVLSDEDLIELKNFLIERGQKS